MKKRVTVILEVDTDDEYMSDDAFIEQDLKQEINCASNSYDFISIDVEQLT